MKWKIKTENMKRIAFFFSLGNEVIQRISLWGWIEVDTILRQREWLRQAQDECNTVHSSGQFSFILVDSPATFPGAWLLLYFFGYWLGNFSLITLSSCNYPNTLFSHLFISFIHSLFCPQFIPNDKCIENDTTDLNHVIFDVALYFIVTQQ